MTDFIKTQQELVDNLGVDRIHTGDGKTWMCEDDVKHLMKEAVTNTGKEFKSKLKECPEGNTDYEKAYRTGYNTAHNDYKQHITNITGVK